MNTLEEIQQFFAQDRFATEQGICIDSAEDGRAVCSVELQDQHLNAMGSAQGGLIFTLADFAFAVAANCAGVHTVTLNSGIHYLRSPKGKTLSAEAVLEHKSRAVCLYRIAVRDELNMPVAEVTTTGYMVQKKNAGS